MQYHRCGNSMERRALLAMLLSALDTNTLPAIRAARDRVREWGRNHPEDYMMREAGEPLALTEDALLAVEHPHNALTAS